ncbi:hypothetical protein ACLK1S_02985 [Escherichia coli]
MLFAISSRRWMSSKFAIKLASTSSTKNISLTSRGVAIAGVPLKAARQMPCLVLTHQAIASGDGQVQPAAVSAMPGTLDDDQALSLVEAMVEDGEPRVMALINEAAARGIQWEALLVEARRCCIHIAMDNFRLRHLHAHGRH